MQPEGHVVMSLLPMQKEIFFSFPRHILSQNEVAHTKLCVCVCVCVHACMHARAHTHMHAYCERYVFHYQTSFSVLNGAFSFSFSGDYRNHLKAKPCLLLLFFFPPCLVGAFTPTVLASVSRGGQHCSSFPGLAERLEGQLEMKLLLSAICLTP